MNNPRALPGEHPRQGGDWQAVRRDPLDHRAVPEGRGGEPLSPGVGGSPRSRESEGGSANLEWFGIGGCFVALLLKTLVFMALPPAATALGPSQTGRVRFDICHPWLSVPLSGESSLP